MKKKMRKWNGKRILSIVLALVLCFSCVDVTAVAAELDNVEEGQESVQETLTDGSDDVKDGDETSDSEDGTTDENIQNPDEKKDGETAKDPDGENGGDDAQNPEEGKDGEDTQNPDEEKDGDDTQNLDGEETPDTGNQESVSENDPEEQEPSVSENDVEALGEVRALAVPAGAIASGTYKEITWVIDKDGKLTVEGTGDFAEPSKGNNHDSASCRGPWGKDWNNSQAIKSAEIGVTGMTDASSMFTGCSKLERISFVGSDLSTVTNMSGMFRGCGSLEKIEWGEKFQTRNVTDMANMFEGCQRLQNLDYVKTFDTSNVTDMYRMFQECYWADDLNLSGWDTSKVTNMCNMFYDCNFSSLTLGGRFTTHNVTNMAQMLGGYSNDPEKLPYVNDSWGDSPMAKWKPDRWTLKGLDLAWLDLSSIDPNGNLSGGGLQGIFRGCDVRQLDFGRLDTSVTTSLSGLFRGCTDMTGMDYSALKTDTITDMSRMFEGCGGRIENLGSLHTEHVTDMNYMFSGNTVRGGWSARKPLTTAIDLRGLDTSNVTDMGGMFFGQGNWKSLDLSNLDTSQVTSMAEMFWGCKSLNEVDLSSCDMSQIVNVSGLYAMFRDCESLTEVKLGRPGTLEIIPGGEEDYPFNWMFSGCSKLERLDLSGLNLEKLPWVAQFLTELNSLKVIYTPYNIKVDVELPAGDWYMADGTKLADNCLPKNLDYSVLLQKGSRPSVSAARMEVSKKKTLYGCGEEINTDDLTVIYYGADGSVRKLSASDGQTDGYTTNAATLSTAQPGTLELVVTYTKEGKTLTGKITLTVAHILTADNITVILPAEGDYNYTYDGQPKQPVPTAVSYTPTAADGTGTPVTLTAGTDYTVSYRSNINAYELPLTGGSGAGTAAPTVIIKGAGRYSGSVTKTFAIGKAAAPAAETMDVIGAQCAQANPKRTADLTGSFAACGKKTGYEITKVEDTKSIFSKTPGTADIKDGVLTYGTNAAQEGDTASIKVKVSFQNYKDAELTVRITMAAKKAAVISGITMKGSVVYSGAPVSHGGEAAAKTEDGKDITGQVTLVYRYSGTMADGTAYPAQGGTAEPPVNAGSYVLTVSVDDDDPDYVGSVSYPFTIEKAEAKVRAKDMVVLMQLEGEGSASVPVDQYQKDFGYTVTGLFNRDVLTKEPSYKVTEDEAGARTVTTIDRSKAGTYYIHPSGADAGMNYELSYRPGILTVSEERVAYTVTLDGMGRCDTFTKSGIKSGALLELTEEERTPVSKEPGYVFAGWFKDKTFDRKKEWNFDADTVQSNLTLYACWLTASGEDGAGLRLCVQEIPDLTYTGSAQKPAVTVYDSDGTTLLKAGKDYTVQYKNNTNTVAVDENGRPKETGGTAKVTNPGKTNEQLTDVAGHFTKDCPYVVITGKGNYADTVYRNFMILPAQISADADGNPAVGGGDTTLAAGFTLKYTDQLVVSQTKEQKPFSSMKYKKGMKAGTDFTVTLGVAGAEGAFDGEKSPLAADWKAEGTLNAKKQYTLPAIPKGYSGAFTLTVTGKGNYAGTVIRKLYVSEKQKLMKNAAITLGKNQKNIAYTGEDVLLTPGYYDADTKKNYKVTSEGVVNGTPEANANDMFLVKAGKESLVWGTDFTIDYAGTNRAVGTATMTLTGKNGYVGTKSVTFKITGTPFSAGTIDVKAYDAAHPNEKDWKASMPYTGRAVTQNQVTLTTKVTQKNPTAKELVYGEHYTIAYKNNVKKGTATMTFTAKPESGYSGSFKKTFKITAQNLSKERLTVETQAQSGVAYCKNGARLPFVITNEAGTVLREGTDYTVKYKNNSAVTPAQTPENKKPLMTVTGKGNYAGKVEVTFKVVQASLAAALDDGIVQVSCAQVQKKDGMKFKDFKCKLVEGKKTLGMGESKDYVIDEMQCTPDMIKAYADAIAAGTSLPQEPVVKVTGKGAYTGEKTIPLGRYIYADRLTAANLYVVVSEGAGQSIYTGGQVTPDVAVYYGDKTAVSAAKKDKVTEETALTAQSGKYKLKKLARKPSENAGDGGNPGNVKDGDYIVSYGANVQAGKNKGSVTVTGAGRYGGSVTVKFEIGKKAIY